MYYTVVSDDTPRVVVPDHDDLPLRIMFECYDAPTGEHRGRDNTYLTVSLDFYWSASISLCACTFILARYTSVSNLVLHPVHHYNICRSR